MQSIAIIIHKTSNVLCERLLDNLSGINIPDGYQVDVIVMEGAANRASAYNEAMHSSDAKYKIYMDESTIIFNKNILNEIIFIFLCNPDVGIIGLYGSEMPIDGDFFRSENHYGIYGYSQDGEHVNLVKGKNPLWWQKVHCLDGALLATSVDIDWDEEVDDIFLPAAQCCRFRMKKYDIVVPMCNSIWCAFGKELSYSRKMLPESDAQKTFFERYKYIIQPLVSILITTYNQPLFFRQALESALNQDYHNIEIVVGDDSTNTDTKELMKGYLNQYKNIRYYYHNGPLGGFGRENMKFILNKCKGEYVNYLFHDDLFLPAKISRMMDYYIKDLDGEIGIVTSARNAIDENGNFLGSMNPWLPDKDEFISANKMARGILETRSNYIGELTTVLLRKSLLKTKRGDFVAGVFAGIRDRAHGDVGTFLECARLGKKCVFINEILSLFRVSSGQNSHNRTIIAHSLMEWLNYITISWLNHIFVEDKKDLHHLYDLWKIATEKQIKAIKAVASNEISADEIVCLKAFNAAQHKDYKSLFDLSIKAIKSYDNNADVMDKWLLGSGC